MVHLNEWSTSEKFSFNFGPLKCDVCYEDIVTQCLWLQTIQFDSLRCKKGSNFSLRNSTIFQLLSKSCCVIMMFIKFSWRDGSGSEKSSMDFYREKIWQTIYICKPIKQLPDENILIRYILIYIPIGLVPQGKRAIWSLWGNRKHYIFYTSDCPAEQLDWNRKSSFSESWSDFREMYWQLDFEATVFLPVYWINRILAYKVKFSVVLQGRLDNSCWSGYWNLKQRLLPL